MDSFFMPFESLSGYCQNLGKTNGPCSHRKYLSEAASPCTLEKRMVPELLTQCTKPNARWRPSSGRALRYIVRTVVRGGSSNSRDTSSESQRSSSVLKSTFRLMDTHLTSTEWEHPDSSSSMILGVWESRLPWVLERIGVGLRLVLPLDADWLVWGNSGEAEVGSGFKKRGEKRGTTSTCFLKEWALAHRTPPRR